MEEDAPMYAPATPPDVQILGKDERFRAALPYCFILDDSYRVVMAGPSGGDDPLASLYEADSQVDELPGPVDRVVRALTASWQWSPAIGSSTAAVHDLQVTVAPLHGQEGRRIAVFVHRTD
jgi:hypothetical protein